jgi:hypothetical protein
MCYDDNANQLVIPMKPNNGLAFVAHATGGRSRLPRSHLLGDSRPEILPNICAATPSRPQLFELRDPAYARTRRPAHFGRHTRARTGYLLWI